MIDIFEGDPKLILDENGASLLFKGGQPVMDRGLENLAFISLFTDEGWAGNVLFDDPDEKIGSTFQKTANQSLTVQVLKDIRKSAIQALSNDAFGNVDASVINTNSYQTVTTIRIEPPGQDAQQLVITKNGLNWIAQNIDPAHRRI